jgi:hypothetical protein
MTTALAEIDGVSRRVQAARPRARLWKAVVDVTRGALRVVVFLQRVVVIDQ